jgi:hypothetical protein
MSWPSHPGGDNVAELSPTVYHVASFIIIINIIITIILCHVCLLFSDIPNQAPSYLWGCLSLETFIGVKICVLYRVTIEINVWFLVTITSCFCWKLDGKIWRNAAQ